MILLKHHEAAFKRVSESRFEYFSEPSTKMSVLQSILQSLYFLFLIVFLIDEYIIEYICHLNYSFFITVKAQMPFTIFLLAHLETLAK